MMTTTIKGNARNYFSSKLVKRFTKIPTFLSTNIQSDYISKFRDIKATISFVVSLLPGARKLNGKGIFHAERIMVGRGSRRRFIGTTGVFSLMKNGFSSVRMRRTCPPRAPNTRNLFFFLESTFASPPPLFFVWE